MTEKIFCIYALFKNRHVGIGALSALSKMKKKNFKKIDAVRFLDASGDENHVITLEWPKIPIFFFSKGQFCFKGQ